MMLEDKPQARRELGEHSKRNFTEITHPQSPLFLSITCCQVTFSSVKGDFNWQGIYSLHRIRNARKIWNDLLLF